jgi:aspartate/methionine/tyrosine aminotransferase
MRRVLPEATLAVYSFSKTYAMTGWRLGYLVAPKPLLDEVRKVAESVFSSTSMPAQRAAEAALAVTAAEIQAMVDAYRARRDLALDLLRAWGRYRYTPKGAFYLMVDVPRSLGAEAAALRLLEEHGVVTVPGTAFGQNAAQALRISLAADEDAIRAGLTAIRDLG